MPGRAAPPTAEDPQELLRRYWDDFATSDQSPPVFVARHLRETAAMVRAVRRLPTLTVAPRGTAGGRAVRTALNRPGTLGSPGRWQGSAVLRLPEDPTVHLDGSHRATLRRKIRKAEAQGVSCAPVPVADRPSLVARAEEAETRHPQSTYAMARPDNSDLLDHDLWLAAYVDDEPIALTVAPVDGRWASLRYLRTLGWDQVHSDARYLLTHCLGVALAERGVHYLLDDQPPAHQTAGIRHFQQMLGYEYVRVRLRRR